VAELSIRKKGLRMKEANNEGLKKNVCLPIHYHRLNRQISQMAGLYSPFDPEEKQQNELNLPRD